MIPIPPALAAFAAKEGIKKAWSIAKIAVPVLLILAIGIYIAVLKGDLRHVTKERDGLREWQGLTIAAVRAEVPVERRKSVDANTARDEIAWIGRERRELDAALTRQTNALNIAKRQAASAQNGVSEALRGAAQRDLERDLTRRALKDPKRSTGLTAAEWGKL